MKFTDLNLDPKLIEESSKIIEKREPIILNPEMHNMDTVQRLQMGDEGYSDREGMDSKERQKDLHDKKHEFYEDGTSVYDVNKGLIKKHETKAQAKAHFDALVKSWKGPGNHPYNIGK